MRFAFLLLALLLGSLSSGSAAIKIVAAENFYGQVAKEIGGDEVEVTSILTNPDQDPHLFTVNVQTAKAIAKAQIVILSGIDYDPWMADMAAAHPNAKRRTIRVASLIEASNGDNPHIWYNPAVMPVFAKKLAADLAEIDPDHAKAFEANLAGFLTSLQPLTDKIAAMKSHFSGVDVIATEPVFGCMSDALGLKMHALGFQNHVMNDTEPTARESEEFETLLKTKKVKVLFYNGQVTDPVTTRMQELARKSGIPIVGVSETLPAGQTYVTWMLAQLNTLEKALGTP